MEKKMKKLFLLIPAGLIAASGWFLINTQRAPDQTKPQTEVIVSKSPEQLFTLSQDSLRLIVRHGEGKSIRVLEESVTQLQTLMLRYEKQGLPIQTTEKLIEQYKADSIALSKATQPNLDKLKTLDHKESLGEEKFLLSIDQIGLFELKSAYKKMDKIRLDYLKEPSEALESEYYVQNENVQGMVRELYLDSDIEKPLFDYIDNHKGYFETVASCYKQAGLERVHRLRMNSYAIKTDLQMLPSM